MNAHEIKEVVAAYFLKKRRAVHFEVGLNRRGRLRADVVALAMNGFLTIVEVKSSPQDFYSDSKWPDYWDYCNQLYLCFTEVVYEKVQHRIPPDVGVFVVRDRVLPSGRTRKTLRVVQRTRVYEIPEETTLNMAVRMAFRSADRNRYKRVSK